MMDLVRPAEPSLPQPIRTDIRRFDYDQLDPQLAAVTRDRAMRIRVLHRTTATTIMEIGCELVRAKASLAHGTFLEWIGRELNFSPTTARNYMRVFRAFSGNSTIVAGLPPATLYKLAGAPERVRADIVALVEDGDVTDREAVERLIVDRRSKYAEADRLAKLSPTERRKDALRRRRCSRRTRKRQERQEMQRAEDDRVANEAASEILGRLRSRFHLTEICELDRLWAQSRGTLKVQIGALYEAGDEEAYC